MTTHSRMILALVISVLFANTLAAQDVGNQKQFAIKEIEIVLESGERVIVPGSKIYGLNGGVANGGLRVIWVKPKKLGNVQTYDTFPKQYRTIKDIQNDKDLILVKPNNQIAQKPKSEIEKLELKIAKLEREIKRLHLLIRDANYYGAPKGAVFPPPAKDSKAKNGKEGPA